MHLRLNLICNTARLVRVLALTALVALATGSLASAAEELAILPAEVLLTGPEARRPRSCPRCRRPALCRRSRGRLHRRRTAAAVPAATGRR